MATGVATKATLYVWVDPEGIIIRVNDSKLAEIVLGQCFENFRDILAEDWICDSKPHREGVRVNGVAM